jgi:hypothetical protein
VKGPRNVILNRYDERPQPRLKCHMSLASRKDGGPVLEQVELGVRSLSVLCVKRCWDTDGGVW